MYQYILFDMDGTVINSSVGVTNAVRNALNHLNIPIKEGDNLFEFLGPPLKESFPEFYGLTLAQCDTALKYYREYYTRQGIHENTVYDGIPELLRTLKAQGRTLILATSKPEYFAVQILRELGIEDLFDLAAGASMDETRTRKSEVIEYAFERFGITDRSGVIMIGDRKHDILGAKQAGVASMGILYGFGDRTELEGAGADYIAETPEDILRVLEAAEREN